MEYLSTNQVLTKQLLPDHLHTGRQLTSLHQLGQRFVLLDFEASNQTMPENQRPVSLPTVPPQAWVAWEIGEQEVVPPPFYKNAVPPAYEEAAPPIYEEAMTPSNAEGVGLSTPQQNQEQAEQLAISAHPARDLAMTVGDV